MNVGGYTLAAANKKNPPVRDQLKCIHACHPCCSLASTLRPILAAITIIFFALFGVMPEQFAYAIVGGISAGTLLLTILFGAGYGATVGCKYVWCACIFKQNELLE